MSENAQDTSLQDSHSRIQWTTNVPIVPEDATADEIRERLFGHRFDTVSGIVV